MVNKLFKRTCFLRPFFSFILIVTISYTTSAQKISKYFTSSMQDDGALYFIEPKQEFKNNDEHCKLFYDLTYLTTNDSITLNFTYSDKEIRKIESLSFIQGNVNISTHTKKLFVESENDIWIHRYSAKFLFNDLDFLFQQRKKASILIHHCGKSVKLEIEKRKWNKQSELLTKILLMIKANIEDR